MGTRMRRALALLLVAAGGAAGVAWATGAVGSGGAITACVKDQNGQLRVVSQGSDCLPSEHVVMLAAPQAAGPANVTVDCAAGQTVSQALADYAGATSLDIGIKGTCTETVRIARDDVRLHGVGSGAGIAAPSASSGALYVDGGRRVGLDALVISGGRWGLSLFDGASVNASSLTFSGVGDQDVTVGGGSGLSLNGATVSGGGEGVSAQSGGSVSVNGGTITGTSSFAVHAHEGGSIFLDGGVVVSGAGFHAVVAQDGGSILLRSATVRDNGGFGVFAFQGGSVSVTRDTLVQGNRFAGVAANAGTAEVDGHVTRNHGAGVDAFNGGHLTIQDGAVVDANEGDGVQVAVGSTVALQGATIANNTGNGIHLSGTSSASFGNGDDAITGNGLWGVFCDGPPSVAQVDERGASGVTVGGNGSGQLDCPQT